MELNELLDKKTQLERDLIKAVSDIVSEFESNNDISLDEIEFDIRKIQNIGEKPYIKVLDVQAKIVL